MSPTIQPDQRRSRNIPLILAKRPRSDKKCIFFEHPPEALRAKLRCKNADGNGGSETKRMRGGDDGGRPAGVLSPVTNTLEQRRNVNFPN